jgi:3-hydroxybutyryl-CoA dehydrogenase
MTDRPAVACIGAGRMGRGMAHAFAYAGHTVVLVDGKSRSGDEFAALKSAALAEVRGTLGMLADLGQFDVAAVDTLMARIRVVARDDARTALRDVRFVFEGVPETAEAKRAALDFVDNVAAPDAIVASTTSTFLSTTLAAMTARPQRFLNAHWLNPAYLVPLVEVSPHAGTERSATDALLALLTSIGKVPVECKASPGYIVPRIQALAMNEAARLVEEGVATAEDVDKAVLYGFGLRFAVLGLIEFIDWGGGDILHYASRYMTDATGQDRFAAPKVVTDNMAAGRIGLKTGEGFYDWRGRDLDAYRRQRLGDFLAQLRHMGQTRPPVL